jgi:hypothetical protein
MAYYLQMDGVDDYLVTPTITFTSIEIDGVITQAVDSKNHYIIDARTGSGLYLIFTGSGKYENGGFDNIYENGVKVANFSTVTTNQRIVYKVDEAVAISDNVNIFSRYTNNEPLKGDIYYVKIYNGTTLIAHYDMSTQTVQDQSGNGNHATLSGGTWVADGTSTTTTHDAIATLNGIGSAVINANYTTNGTSTILGNSDLSANGIYTGNGISSLLGISSVTVSGIRETFGNSELFGQSNLTATIDRIVLGDASLLGFGSINTSANLTTFADTSLFGIGSLSSTPQRITIADATFIGSGTLSAVSGSITVVIAEANLSGMGSIVAEGLRVVGSVASLNGTGSLNTESTRITSADVSMFGQSSLTAKGSMVYIVDANLIGAGTLEAMFGEKVELIGTTNLSGQQVLNVYLLGKQSLNVNLKGLIH